jgi:outer membrane receptor for ferric coprogen and ferric-rhodotorulic acid
MARRRKPQSEIPGEPHNICGRNRWEILTAFTYRETRHLLKLWSSTQLPGDLGSFAVIDLRAGYQIDAHWRAALSINNVFDRIYYQTIGTPLNGSWYGAPRGFVLRIDGKY